MSTTDKFEFASEAWIAEAFRLVREAAFQHPEMRFSFCEVFTGVPARLNPDDEGKVAWYGRIEGGHAELAMGELSAEEVDIKTIGDWSALLPSARYRIDLSDPEDLARCHALTARAVAEGRIRRLGDRSKTPPVFLGIHNALADRTA